MDSSLDRDSLVKRADALACAPMGEGLAITHLDHDSYFVVDAVGLEVWERMDRPIRVAELAAVVAAGYEVEQEACEADVLRFLEQLQAKALLVVV